MARSRARTWLLVVGVAMLGAAVGFWAKVWLDRVQPSELTDVAGLQIQTVSQVLNARLTGKLKGEPVALRGYWSALMVGHTCVAPPQGQPEPGVLELACFDGQWGITELEERIMTWHRIGDPTVAIGPKLSPYAPDDILRVLLDQPLEAGPDYPPVPIIVLGHFDDPRAADCSPERQQVCRDRLVIDRLVQFDRSAVVIPPPTPWPTPFPSGQEPAALFEPKDCAGDVEYEFEGWTTLTELGIDGADPREHVYAMVTDGAVPLADWSGPYQHKARLWGQRICYRYIRDSAMHGEVVRGTTFRELQDGTHEPWMPP